MLLRATFRPKAHLNAILIRADGSRQNFGDLESCKPWYQRLWEYISFDQRGLVTDAGLNFLAQNFTGETDDVSLFKYHDSGTGTTAAAQTDTTLQTQAGPTTRATGTNTQTQSASGTGNTTPAIVQSVATISYTSSLAITEWGLFSQSSQGGTMWDHRVFAAINVVSGDSIQFTYSLSLPGGGS
jgi:hypothetical protein